VGIVRWIEPVLLVSPPVGLVIFLVDQDWEALYFGLFPLFLSAVVVVATFLVVGLPVTRLLVHLNRETFANYVRCGLAVGIFGPPLLMGLLFGSDGLAVGGVFSFFGALGGSVTASVWGEARVGRQLKSEA